ncbi:MAG: MFS transporter [Acidimicrobiia bacterium]|nr:MFS transporter [Acidimicrobiia bacterium]
MSNPEPPLHLYRWRSRPVLGVALLMVAVGFCQFSPAAVLADVAEYFGEPGGAGDTIAEQAGLSGTALGIGLATIRVASLGALALAALADRRGRRRTALWWVSAGIAMTVVAAGAPSYWWFVVALALARPLLTATNTIGQVLAAEYTSASQRTWALALVAASYGIGAGLVVVLRAVLETQVSFRGVFAAAAVAWVLVAVAARLLVEPERFTRAAGVRLRLDRSWFRRPPAAAVVDDPVSDGATDAARTPVPGSFRRRFVVVAALVMAASAVTAPANTFLFVFAEGVLDASASLTAALVVSSAPLGLGGLLVGRALADRLGRRPTVAIGLAGLGVGAAVAYSGSTTALAVGFLGAVFIGSVFATPMSAMASELFPTSIRASVAGWMVVLGVTAATAGLFGVGWLADRADSFGVAMMAVAVPAVCLSLVVAAVPETRGLELEDSAPESLRHAH